MKKPEKEPLNVGEVKDIPRGWIALTEVSDGDKHPREVIVQIDCISAVDPKRSYTTLWVSGSWLHVSASAQSILDAADKWADLKMAR